MNDQENAVSAGGVVVKIINGTSHILLIRDSKHDDWVLPKGHIENGESLEQAAKREVIEEAGLDDVKIIQLLGTYRRFVEKANEHKTIHYFLMETGPSVTSDIDFSTEKDEIKWFPLDQLPKFFLAEQEDVIRKNVAVIQQSQKALPA